MMVRITMIVAALTTLIACDAGPIQGTRDSGVSRLEVGMSVQQVNDIIGNPVMIGEPAQMTGLQCYSYLYDEVVGAKYAHLRFIDEALVTASDRHRKPCDPA